MESTNAPVAANSCSTSGKCSMSPTKRCLLAGLGSLFVLLNLAALWALHFADRPVTKSSVRASVSGATSFTSSQFAATTGLTPKEGDAVSFNSEGVLRNGAGTSAYLNKLTLNASVKAVGYINFAPMGTSSAYYSTNVLSYSRTTGTTTESVVSTFSYDAGAKTLTAATIDTTNNVIASDKVRGLATLSDTRLVALTVSSAYVAYIVPASLNGASGTVTLNQAKRVALTADSATQFVSPLSSSAFVAVYYDSYMAATVKQHVKVGSVATDGTITFSTDTPDFGGVMDADFNTQFGAPLALKGLTTSTTAGFVVPYYITQGWNSTKTDAEMSGLCVTSATFTASTNAVSNFTTGVCHTGYRPDQLISSVALGDNAMAIAFHDKANNNALTVAVVTVSSTDASLHFRSSYVFQEVNGDFEYGTVAYAAFSTTPMLRVLSGNRLAVSFLNPTLDGRLSVRVLSFSPSTLAFRDVTPVLPVGASDFTLAITNGTNSAVTHDLLPVGSDGFVAAYVGLRGTTVNQNFAVVEAFGEPVGVIESYSSTDGASITMQGEAEVSGLTSGKVHYATTSGFAVALDSAARTSNSSDFFYAADNTMLVTTDSRLGVAVSDDTLFISTAF
ncbi:hypothetical protein BBJ28_00017768 [Nothophytophthora sp. Chile5]|nr:hypothetical protein BBJ28_00017768 [Nothophytophthora sp. Chile5]